MASTSESSAPPAAYTTTAPAAANTTERILTLILIWASAAALTYVFYWMDPELVNATLFSAVFAYWGLFFTFYYGLYLGLGGAACYSCTLETEVFSPAVFRKAVGTALALIATAVSVALTTKFAQFAGPEGARGLDFVPAQVFSLLPLHWGFVWLVFVQHLKLV
jgi:hypothetical protein